MSVQPGQRAKHLTAFLFGLGLLLALTLVLASQTATPTSGTEGGPEMRLLILEPADACADGLCQLETGQSFKLGVEIVRGPSPLILPGGSSKPGGYILAQTSIFYGGNVTYDISPAAADEIVWPDCNTGTALKSQVDRRLPILPNQNNTTELISHGCLTGLVPPQPVSEFTGVYLEIVMTCSAEDTNNPIELLPYTELSDATPDTIAGTSGTEFRRPNNGDVIPKLVGLTLICGEAPTPTPGPTRTPGGPSPTPTPTLGPATPTPTPTATPDASTPTPTFVSALPCGDINGDRRVNAEDALWLLWFSSNMIPSLPNPGDVNGDGVVDPLDALFVLWIELNLFRCL